MILGYVTSGFAHHSLEDAICILADIGYRSVAITLDHHHLNPLDDDWPHEAASIRRLLDRLQLRCTIETGARFLLDPRRKHRPTLISSTAADRDRRIAYLCRAVDVAHALNADSVSIWSGAADETDANNGKNSMFDRLIAGLRHVLSHAEQFDIPIGFEPEPGMFIERMSQFEKLHAAVDHPLLALTLDVGHVQCLADDGLIDHLKRWHHALVNIHLEDMRRGRHEHLFFGEGEINFTEVMNSLDLVGYRGPVHVELSRHSHDAPDVAARAYEFLSAISGEHAR
ncbi:MAG: sugar phosphate isomerase/epimerase [Phycisphaerales bacterium]|nr:sugar phosphate isomerase/epimerase [Phycisphaerales bacterium]